MSVCSAKQLVRGEPNVSYICSRYYRAPELIFGATDYTSSIGRPPTGVTVKTFLYVNETHADKRNRILDVLYHCCRMAPLVCVFFCFWCLTCFSSWWPASLCRCVVSWLCTRRAVARTTNLPWRQWCGSAGWNY